MFCGDWGEFLGIYWCLMDGNRECGLAICWGGNGGRCGGLRREVEQIEAIGFEWIDLLMIEDRGEGD
jgi:hypothetical protein